MKIIFFVLISFLTSQVSAAPDVFSYEITKSTYNSGSIVISTSVATLINLTPTQCLKASGASWNFYSTSLWNVSVSTAVYTIVSSFSTAPILTCGVGPMFGSGSATSPFILTEQFEGLYMWVKACSASSITMQRALRGR